MITWIHKYGILQHHCPENTLCSYIHPTLPLTHQYFTVSIVVPFPEFHGVGMVPHVAFSEWLLSLNNTHLEFLHVLLWLKSKALLLMLVSECLFQGCVYPASLRQPHDPSVNVNQRKPGWFFSLLPRCRPPEFLPTKRPGTSPTTSPASLSPGNLHRASF